MKSDPLDYWHDYFLWMPVKVEDRWAWLKVVERKRPKYINLSNPQEQWVYRRRLSIDFGGGSFA